MITIEELRNGLKENGYFPTDEIVFAVASAINCNIPLLIEGAAGAGKTSLAEAVASLMKRKLLNIQFYEGVTEDRILYDYDYQRQLLTLEAIKPMIADELRGKEINEAISHITKDINFYGEEFLIKRPVLQALTYYKDFGQDCVLLLDEIDKASEEVEYALLEVLAKYSVSIPQYKTITCEHGHAPIIFITSNKYRELSDAFKRRCNYLYIEDKTKNEMLCILKSQKDIYPLVAKNIATCMEKIAKLDLHHAPSISEAIQWGRFLSQQFGNSVTPKEMKMSSGVLIKDRSDIKTLKSSGILMDISDSAD